MSDGEDHTEMDMGNGTSSTVSDNGQKSPEESTDSVTTLPATVKSEDHADDMGNGTVCDNGQKCLEESTDSVTTLPATVKSENHADMGNCTSSTVCDNGQKSPQESTDSVTTLPATVKSEDYADMSNGTSSTVSDNGQKSPEESTDSVTTLPATVKSEESTDSVMTVSSFATCRVSHDGNLPPCARGMYTSDNAPLDVRLEFQGKGGGLLVFKDQKHLDIVPPVGATNYVIKQSHTKTFTPQEGGGVCVAFMSQEFSSYIIGCPKDNFVVKCDVSPGHDHCTWWRKRFYRSVFPDCCREYHDSTLLQLWEGRYQITDPRDQRALYFIIDGDDQSQRYKLGPPDVAKTKGAFNIASASH